MIQTVEKLYINTPNGNVWGNTYKVTYTDNTVKFVPLDEANTDYQMIMEWVENGGVIVDNGA